MERLSKSSPIGMLKFELYNVVRIAPQLLGNVSYYFENLPSNWGTFRTTSKTSPVAGERFVLLRKPPQLLGNASYCFESLPSCWGAFPASGILPQSLGSISSSGIPSPVAGEHFQLRDSFPSCWGAFPAPGILPQSLGSVSSFRNPSPAPRRVSPGPFPNRRVSSA